MAEVTGDFEAVAVPQALAGERLDRAVAMITTRPRSEVDRLIAASGVSIDGNVVLERSRRLKEGETLGIATRLLPAVVAPPTVAVAAADVAFEVVFDDTDVIVVNKPVDLVTHPGAGTVKPTLVDGLLALYPEIGRLPSQGCGSADRPGIVHRLDRETSGLLVVARSARGYSSLTAQLAARTAKRTYLALVLGTVRAAEGVVDAPIGRSQWDPTKMAVSAEGREARTSYVVKSRFTKPIEASELELKLDTGRTHQIRVHLSAIGHPVLGDARYGGSRRSAGVRRMMLHAARLGYVSPATGEALEFEAPIPADFQESLGKFS